MIENEELFKIITLGDGGVGKTSIVKRFIRNVFEDDTLSTVGVAFSFKEVTVENGKKIKLKFVDTAGQEKYRALAKSYYKNAEAVLFVFSYDDKKSFDHIEEWLNRFKEYGGNKEEIPLFLVGNKCDIENKVIEDNLIENLKNRIGFKYFKKTSAKDNIGIEELFNELSEKMYQQNKKNIGKEQKNKHLENNGTKEMKEKEKEKEKNDEKKEEKNDEKQKEKNSEDGSESKSDSDSDDNEIIEDNTPSVSIIELLKKKRKEEPQELKPVTLKNLSSTTNDKNKTGDNKNKKKKNEANDKKKKKENKK